MWYKHVREKFAAMTGVSTWISNVLFIYLFIVIFLGNTNVRVHDNVNGSACTCGGIQILVFLF